MNPDLSKVAVVILNWNGVSLLKKYIPSVVEFSAEAKIYVIDNASTDKSVSFLKDNYPQIQIIHNSENFGFAKGYNFGLKQVKEPNIILLNSDIEVTKNWILPLVEVLESDKQIAAVQPKILDFKNKDYFEYAGASGGYIDFFGFPFCRGRIFNTLEKDLAQYDNLQEIFWATGAAIAIKKEVFEQVSGFDEDFFAHQEEIDLCWRIKNKGYKIFCEPKSKVYHLGGGTLNENSPRKTFYNFRNSLLMLLKNLPQWYFPIIIFFRLCLDGLAGVFFMLKGQPKHTWAIVKSHFNFYANLKRTLLKRNNPSLSKYYKTNSIIIKYFVMGYDKFSKI